MNGTLVIDTNLLVLLVVGAASKEYILKHKRLKGYTVDDFDMVSYIISDFNEVVLLPHILAEVSNITRQTDVARNEIQKALRALISSCTEFPIQSAIGARRIEFDRIGLTDSVILSFCAMNLSGINPTLLTADTPLANIAHSDIMSLITGANSCERSFPKDRRNLPGQ